MKRSREVIKLLLLSSHFFIVQLFSLTTNAQVICILCFNQNDSISTGVNNLIQNGGFENHNCTPSVGIIGSPTSYCPNSGGYSCDINNWTCTGGGSDTYACIYSLVINKSKIVEGNYAAYFGNYFCNACSGNPGDTSCIVMNDCVATGLPVGYPANPDVAFGGPVGVSIQQTVNGLIPLMTYVLEFWAGGENIFPDPGLFAVDVGFGDTILRNVETNPVSGIGTRYIVEFRATSSSHTIKFTNWGHICSTCTELVLDDVRLYSLAELNPSVTPCALSAPVAAFTGPNEICPGICTDFTNLSLNGFSYIWNFPGGNPSFSTDQNPSNICYNNPGNYPVTLIATNSNGSDTLTLNNYITVFPIPPSQGIIQNGDTLIANQGADSYQWYMNSNLIAGATDYFFISDTSGNYSVVATDENGCEVEAVINNVIAGTENFNDRFESVSLFPIPASENIVVSSSSTIHHIKIVDIVGKEIFSENFSAKTTTVDIHHLNKGIYYLKVQTGKANIVKSFIRE